MLESRMDFVAIDAETANADMASICQIGVAKYNNGIFGRGVVISCRSSGLF